MARARARDHRTDLFLLTLPPSLDAIPTLYYIGLEAYRAWGAV